MKTRLLQIVVIAYAALLLGCAARPALNVDSLSMIQAPQEDRTPKLILEAHPRVGFAPLRVSVRAVVQNVPFKDRVFACLWKSWAFGDGSVSSEKGNCDDPDLQMDPEYYVEHVYDREGVYQVRFVLGDQQVLSNPVNIRVIGRN